MYISQIEHRVIHDDDIFSKFIIFKIFLNVIHTHARTHILYNEFWRNDGCF